jgi:hypothetical protein
MFSGAPPGWFGVPAFLYDRQGILRDKVVGFKYTEHFEDEVKPRL